MLVSAPVFVTYEESLLRPESRYEEVVDGELRLMPPASVPHAWLLRRIQRELQSGLTEELDFLSETGFLITKQPLSYRIPDLAIVPKPRSIWDYKGHYLEIAPVAILEILSPGNRQADRSRLLEDYGRLGCLQIFFLDLEQQTLEINGKRHEDDRFQIAGVPLSMAELFR